jgi:hypothetical protein
MPTTKLGLPTIAGNASADVVRDMNALASAVDDKAGVAEGLATLDATGKVPSTQVPAVPNASTSVAGKVMLEDSVTSISVGKAATPKAVKAAYDLASEAKTQANDQKTKWASVIGSPLLATDTSTVLQTKSQTIKNTLATNLTNKGQTATGTESLTSLVNKVPLISTGKKYATGTVNPTTLPVTVTGLSFQPSIVRLTGGNGTSTYTSFIYVGDDGSNIQGYIGQGGANHSNGPLAQPINGFATNSIADGTGTNYIWEAWEG